MRISWTDKLVKSAQKILGKHTKDELEHALSELSQKAGQKVTADALDSAFRKRNLPSPHTFLKAPAYVPHPVEQHEAKKEAQDDKRTIKQLVEELRQTKARQDFLDAVHGYKEPPKIMPREKNSGIREMTAVVLASDWHVEEPVDPEAVAYRNEYNLDIAEKRIERFFQGIIWNIEHQRASKRIAIRDLVLWLGGDLITGYIHPELVESNLLSPTETVLWLMPRLHSGIATLVERLKLDSIVVPCSFGNHGRTTEKVRVSTGYANSYEWLMYHSLAGRFDKDERVRFEVTNSRHQYVQVYDKVLHFHHGDEVRYQGGVGGIAIPLLKAVPQWDLIKRADYHHIGHFHQLTDFGRVVVNGSLIGYGPYSQSIRASFEAPQQMLYYIDSKRGKCMTTPLWVDAEEVYTPGTHVADAG